MGKTKITFVSILLILITSCSEEITPTPYSYTKVFTGATSKTWIVKFLEQTLDGVVKDTFNVSWASDDEYIFYANPERAFKATTSSKKCSTDEPDIIIDTWSLNNASATLTMVLPFFSLSGLPFIVREAKKNDMVLEFFLDEENTTSYRIHLESIKEN